MTAAHESTVVVGDQTHTRQIHIGLRGETLQHRVVIDADTQDGVDAARTKLAEAMREGRKLLLAQRQECAHETNHEHGTWVGRWSSSSCWRDAARESCSNGRSNGSG